MFAHSLHSRVRRTGKSRLRSYVMNDVVGFVRLEQRILLANWSGTVFDSTPGTPTWTNSSVQIVTGNVTVPAGKTLTIEEGTIIKFESGTNLIVDGTLVAQGGSGSQTIYFTSYDDESVGGDTGGTKSPALFDWGQIQFASTSTNSVLNGVEVSYGSQNVAAEVEVDGSSPSITNSTISNSGYFGVRLSDSDATLTGDTFQGDGHYGNGAGAISMDLASQPVIQNATYTNNYVNGVVLDSGSLPTGTTTWNDPGAVYWFTGNITVPVGATLDIDPGLILKLGGSPLKYSLTVNGRLQAQGTSAQPVIFTSNLDDSAGGDTNNDGAATTPAVYNWGQILFTSTSTGDVLNNVVARYGGADASSAEVEADGSSPSITNSTIAASGSDGLRLTGSDATLTTDTLQNNGSFNNGGAAISMDLASQPVIQNDTFTNNHVNGVVLDGGALPAGTTTWNNASTVYWLTANVTVPASSTLVVDPGQIIKAGSFGGNGWGLIVSGTLQAQGTAAQPVIFTSEQDDSAGGDTNNDGSATSPNPYNWSGIQFTSTSTNNIINHVEVRYGGQVGIDQLAAIEVDDVGLTFTNSVVRDSGHGGIDARAGANVTLDSNLFLDNTNGTAFEAQAGSTMTAVNNTIDKSFIGAIVNSNTITLTNNIITNSSNAGIQVNGVSSLNASYNDLYNPVASNGNYNNIANLTGTSGNLSVNPRYFNAAALQYGLVPGSPVEDSGTSKGAPTTDFFGNPRFKDPNIASRGDGSGVDMGAIETQQTASSNVDLATTAVSGPATGLQGQTATVNWTVQNVGTAAAIGPWHDTVYLSSSPTWTPDAILLGTGQYTGNLAPGASYNASASVTLPGVVPGNDYFIVRTNSENEVFEGTSYLNNTLASANSIAMDLPAVTLGSSVNGTLATAGASEMFKVVVPSTSALSLQLTGAVGTANELYVAFGNVPTSQAFLARGVVAGQANQSITLASAQPGTYYVLVDGASVPASESFTLTATAPSGFGITSVLPIQGSDVGQVTITVNGSDFDANSQPQLIDSAGKLITPVKTYYLSPGQIAATFNLSGHATGAASVQVVESGIVKASEPKAFTINSGQSGQLVTNLTVASAVRVGRTFTIEVQYRNVGNTDLLAPALNLEADGPTQISLYSDLRFLSNEVDLVGVNSVGPAGILPPGASGTITVYGTATASGNTTYSLNVGTYVPGPIDWASIAPTLEPSNMTAQQFAPILAQVEQDVGSTWADYQADIASNTTLMPSGYLLNYSLMDNYEFEIEKAEGLLSPTVTGTVYLGDTNHPAGSVPIDLVDPTTGNAYSTISLTDGTFVIPDVPPATYDVTFGNDMETTPSTLVVGSSPVTTQFVVSPGGSISGSVMLAGAGEPLADEVVTAYSNNGYGATATTDANGQFTLTGLPADTYTVTTGGGTYTQQVDSGVTVAAGSIVPNVAFSLAIGGTISGKVTGPSGPVAGAIVTATGQDGTSLSADTASDGTYTITGLGRETYAVDAYTAGLAPPSGDPVALRVGESVMGVNLTMVNGGAIQGTITSTVDSSPVANLAVTLASGNTSYPTTTDDNGQFTVGELPPGTYTVTTDGPDSGVMTDTTTVAVTAGSITPVTLTEAPLGKITGKVSNSNGQPIGAVVVYATNAQGQIAVTTDSSGDYELDGLDVGAFQVFVGDQTTPGLTSTTVTVSPAQPATTANFTLALAGAVSGTVFESDGKTPLTGSSVSLIENGQQILTMTTNANGDYDFDIVSPGTYQFEATAPATDFPIVTNIAVSGGSVRSGLNFTAGTDTIAGTITDTSTGNPIAGANVEIDRADPGVEETFVGTVTTASNGSFQFPGLVPGAYTVVISATGYATASQNVTVVHGVTAAVAVSLGAQSTVQGTLRDANTGAVLAGATVFLTNANGLGTTTTTEANGNYVASDLSAGMYSVSIFDNGYETVTIDALAIGQGQKALNFSLAPAAISVSGTVTGGGAALANVQIKATDAAGALAGSALTGANGSYTLTNLAPGTYTIVASAAGYLMSAPLSLTVQQGSTLSSENLSIIPSAMSDIVIDPAYAQFINSLLDETPGDSFTLLAQTPPVQGYSLTAVEESALATTDAHCQAARDAANQAIFNTQFLFAFLTSSWSEFKTNHDALAMVESAIGGELTQLQLILNKITKAVGGAKGKEAAQLAALGSFVPNLGDLTAVKAADQTINAALAGSDPDKAQTLLQAAMAPGGSIANLQSKCAFLAAIANILVGDDYSEYKPYLSGVAAFALEGFAAAKVGAADTNNALINLQLEQIGSIPFSTVQRLGNNLNLLIQDNSQCELFLGATIAYYASVRQVGIALADLIACESVPCEGFGPTTDAISAADPMTDNAISLAASKGVTCNSIRPPKNGQSSTADQDDDDGIDPNDMIGPAGYGAQDYVQPSIFAYDVEFENDPAKATAAVQVVTVTETLDANFDLSTFQFTGFGFGSSSFTVPAGLSHYQATIDLRSTGVDLLVPVTLDVNPQTRVLTATFESLDPLTDQAPDGVEDGFLPIDDAAHDGEGYITFTVQPKAGLPTGTSIHSQASIVFDANASIATPNILNSIDAGAPTSAVTALPARSSTNVKVQWSGQDDKTGSGIAFYNVYVSDNGGPYTLFQSATSATSAMFTGQVGHTYSFYSVATDNVGNVQPTPTAAQATTTIANITEESPSDFLGLGHSEPTVYRPSTAAWFVQKPGGATQSLTTFGWLGHDIPVPGDYDGVGHTEQAVYRLSTGQWFVREPNGTTETLATFGWPGHDMPVPGDYDGVGHTEQAVYRPSTAQWFVLEPNGTTKQLQAFGWPSHDIPAPGDYDGVGHVEQAVYRPSTGQWFVLEPNGKTETLTTFGWPGHDLPVSAPIDSLLQVGVVGGIKASSLAPSSPLPATPSPSVNVAVSPVSEATPNLLNRDAVLRKAVPAGPLGTASRAVVTPRGLGQTRIVDLDRAALALWTERRRVVKTSSSW
jgi:Carboxypeptidase regulatory-like domain/CARDB